MSEELQARRIQMLMDAHDKSDHHPTRDALRAAMTALEASVGAAPTAGQPEEWRAAKRTEGPNEDGYFTAGIDTPYVDWRDEKQWHLNAIEFHSKDKALAEQRRDDVLSARRSTATSDVAVAWQFRWRNNAGQWEEWINITRSRYETINHEISVRNIMKGYETRPLYATPTPSDATNGEPSADRETLAQVFEDFCHELGVSNNEDALLAIRRLKSVATEAEIREIYSDEDDDPTEPMPEVIATHDGEWRREAYYWRFHDYPETPAVHVVTIADPRNDRQTGEPRS